MDCTLAGSQRANHKLGRVFAPQHDVDALASQLVGHGIHARTAHTHAGADGIYALVVADHGNLGTAARDRGRSS